MKYQFSLPLVSLALSAVVSAGPLVPASAGCIYPIGFGKSKNAKPAGRLFEIDGKVTYFAGTNAWWLAHLSSNADVDIAISQMVDTQYKIARVWAFGDVTTLPSSTNTDPNKVYFQYLNASGSHINYGEDGIQRLDYVVHSAEKHGLKLVLPFFNNWGDYGGIAAYNTAFGGNATTWYTDAKSQATYKSYIKTIVSRYKKSTAIFAWELGNEPRCKGCDSSVITKWATEISTYIKSLDPGHMVTLGDEGWLTPADGYGDGSYAYSGVEGVDFVENLKIKTLDYGTVHLYPSSWGYNYTWGSTWIAQHDAIGAASGKPVILEEYGAPFPGNHTATEYPWQQAVEKSGIAADQIWEFSSHDLSIPGKDFTDEHGIYYGDEEYELLGKKHAADMLLKKVVRH